MKRELALGVAATLLFYMSILIVPVAGIFAGIFTPLPTLLSFYRWGIPLGYWIPGGAGVLGSLLLAYLGMAQSIPYFLGLLGLGLLLGVGMRRGWSVEKTIGFPSFLLFVMGAVTFWLGSSGVEGGLVHYLEEDLRRAISAMLQQYGGSSPEKSLLEHTLLAVVPTVVRLIPGGALSTVLVSSWLNILVAMRYCRIHSVPLPSWVEWPRWRAPEYLVWGVIAGGFSLVLPSDFFRVFGMNALMVFGTIYFFQGLAVIAFYLEHWKLPPILRAILYGFFLLQQFATLGAMLLGLFDVWFDFRRLTRKPDASP